MEYSTNQDHAHAHTHARTHAQTQGLSLLLGFTYSSAKAATHGVKSPRLCLIINSILVSI